MASRGVFFSGHRGRNHCLCSAWSVECDELGWCWWPAKSASCYVVTFVTSLSWHSRADLFASRAGNAILFALMVISCLTDSLIANRFGLKAALIFSKTGYALYSAALYTKRYALSLEQYASYTWVLPSVVSLPESFGRLKAPPC